MIFQRGNPLDYERWAADPGMADWDYAHCLPYFKRMENCLAADDSEPFRGKNGPLVLERGPAANPLFGAFFAAVQQAGVPAHRRRQRLPAGGLRRLRPEHPPGPAAVRRARLPASGDEPGRTSPWPPAPSPPRSSSRARARSASSSGTGGKVKRVRSAELILSGGAINSPQLLQLSGVGNAAELSGLGIDVVADLPGVGENLQDHLEVYVQYGSKLPVSVAPALKWRNRPMVGAKWLFLRSGPGATNHFEGGGFARSNDDVAYPNLMFHFLPIAIRYDGSQPAGGHGYQVHIGPMYSDSRGTVQDHLARPERAPRAAVQLPVHADRPAGMDRGDPDRQDDPDPAGLRRVQRGRAVARPRGPDRRGDPGLGGPRRRDRAAPLLHGQDGDRRDGGDLPQFTCGCTAWRGCGWSTRRSCPTSPTATSTRRS